MNHSSTHFSSILVIATRQIGDVLLVTPLLHSLRSAYPTAKIDVLAYKNMWPMLKGNSDINQVIEVVEKPTFKQSWQLLKTIFRKYSLSITTLSGDKPHIYAWLASNYRVGVVDDRSKKTLLKRLSCKHWVLLDNINTHTILQNLKLAQCLDIPQLTDIKLPKLDQKQHLLQQQQIPFKKYIIIHPIPMWTYKQLNIEVWKEIIAYLLNQNINVLISGGPDENEKSICDQLAKSFSGDQVISLAGKINIEDLVLYLQQAIAYIGLDTSITHMSAASNCKTIAIFGPSNVVKWGPWPANYNKLKNPYIKKHYPWQQVNNTLILQAKNYDCLPCYEEGCDRHKKSQSKCLQELSAKKIIEAIDSFLDLEV